MVCVAFKTKNEKILTSLREKIYDCRLICITYIHYNAKRNDGGQWKKEKTDSKPTPKKIIDGKIDIKYGKKGKGGKEGNYEG